MGECKYRLLILILSEDIAVVNLCYIGCQPWISCAIQLKKLERNISLYSAQVYLIFKTKGEFFNAKNIYG